MESSGLPETPVESEDAVYPCKGCGEILEEGKAFELAGNRWHIDCFRCNTCGTLLDSDANLLLLGDGSLICNNCTYSCSACGNKIEDLAILTGDQAFCASCFKCRNCKKKIENLRYAKTSQGIFCMQCHETLMARRRKKPKPAQRAPSTNSNGSSHGNNVLEKSLPALPSDSYGHDHGSPGSGHTGTPTDRSNGHSTVRHRKEGSKLDGRREAMAPGLEEHKENLELLSRTYSGKRFSNPSSEGGDSRASVEGSYIPVAFDPSLGDKSFSRSLSGDGQGADDLQNGEEDFLKENFKDLVAGSSLARASSTERRSPVSRASPHIASQDTRTPNSSDIPNNLRRGKESPSNSFSPAASPSTVAERTPSQRQHAVPGAGAGAVAATTPDKNTFKLQEPPKTRLSGSKRDSDASGQENSNPMALASQTDGSPILETGVAMNFAHDESTAGQAPPVPRRRGSFKKSPLSNPSSDQSAAGERLYEEPSMRPVAKQQIPRKEVPRQDVDASAGAARPNHFRKGSSARHDPSILGDKNISLPMNVAGSTDGFEPPPRSSSRPSGPGTLRHPSDNDDFTAPREAPAPPRPPNKTNDSSSSLHSEALETISPMPTYDMMGDNFAEGDRDEEAEHPGLFRKVSKVVRHGRSQSDKIGGASPRWQKSRNGSVDISSPLLTTPNEYEDSTHLRNKLRFSQQRVAELESEKNLLQEKVNGTVEIRQVSTELREKRSTVAFLETQREMVIHELEIMTEHLTQAKEGNGPANIEKLRNESLHEFGSAMEKLKFRLQGQIEELVQRKNEVTSEISNLIQMKDKGFLEFESLSSKNAQLTEMNNELVRQIQDIYKQHRGQNLDSTAVAPLPAASGLGIYTSGNAREKSESGMDLRGALALDSSTSHLSGETEVEHASGLNAPQVVNIRKGQPKKFNWKKGSESMAKNVKKGFRGAFGSASTTTLREEPFTESTPYGAMQAGEAPMIVDKPVTARLGSNEGRQPAPGWNMLSQKGPVAVKGGVKEVRDAQGASLPADGALLGSDLTSRCDHEMRVIPTIVTRCVEEVETRGKDQEGIYRKSGSQTQVKSVLQGLERDGNGFDLSDPDLDINAVTGALKHYLRRLPNPLIAFECYQGVLDTTLMTGPDLDRQRNVEMAKWINQMPRAHRDTLEFLIFHLVRVMEYSKENLMTPHNLAVVFAPTIMRSQSPERDVTDMEPQRKAVQCLLQNSRVIFGHSEA